MTTEHDVTAADARGADGPDATTTLEPVHDDPSGAAQVAPGAPVGPRSGATLPPARVASMFDDIAHGYERMNTLMTLGADARWRRRALADTRLRAGDSALDVATGTGQMAALLADRVGPFGRVEGLDLSPSMIDRATSSHHSLVQLRFQVGDAMELPFADGEFDAVTICFGLRNLPDFAAGVREMARVVRPGGRFVCLELAVPRRRAWGTFYHGVFKRMAPIVARTTGSSRDAYRYLPSSLDGFPTPPELSALMSGAGLVDVHHTSLALGIVTLHRGTVAYPARGAVRPRSAASSAP